MFGLNWLKIAIYGGSALLMIGMIWTINSWRIDSNHLEVAVKQKEAAEKALKDEKDCLVGTSCEALIRENAANAEIEVAKAKADADKANKAERTAKEEVAEAKAREERATVKQHQAELANIKLHQNTPSCQKWREEIDPCATH